MKTITAAVLSTLFAAQGAWGQISTEMKPVPCGLFADITKFLAEKHGEVAVMLAKTAIGPLEGMSVMTMNVEKKTYTVLDVLKDEATGTAYACIVATGSEFQVDDKLFKLTPAPAGAIKKPTKPAQPEA